MKFRTRLLTAAGVSAMLFAGVMLAAMASADSQPMGANGTEPAANGPPVACARSIEQDTSRTADAGYYLVEYAARRRCDPAGAAVQ
jgi:hypothetical protein